jgi:ABC-type transport system involved in multi-copper enzyme maturation permease subunit
MNTPTFQILRTLIAKDWRLFRVPMIALIIVGMGCYLLAAAAFSYNSLHESGTEPRGRLIVEMIFSASISANGLTCFIACALGGIAIAGERADRTGTFIGLLPVTRLQIILSKLLTSMLILGIFAVFHLLVGAICIACGAPIAAFHNTLRQLIHNGLFDFIEAAGMWLGFATSLFGVGWLFSTFLNSGPISACIAIAVTAVAMMSVTLCLDGRNIAEWVPPVVATLVGFGIGLPSLIGGSAYYLRRIAP